MHRTATCHVIGTALLAAGCAGPAWHHVHDADAPLVGGIYDVETREALDEDRLLARLSAADFVLLGEKHDNVDHHRLQARVVRRLGERGEVRAVVFEMMGTDRQAAIDAHLRRRLDDAEGLGEALDWSDSGWPAWELYRPIAREALNAGAAIVGGNLPEDRVMAVATNGAEALPDALAERTGLDRPLTDVQDAALRRELIDAHCGHVPGATYLDDMASVQRARDASMADSMVGAAGEGATILIAGTGHVRTDRGVPLYLRRLTPGRESVSLALLEAPEGEALPDDLPYDFVWFTPSSDPPGFDPCDTFREQLERMRDG